MRPVLKPHRVDRDRHPDKRDKTDGDQRHTADDGAARSVLIDLEIVGAGVTMAMAVAIILAVAAVLPIVLGVALGMTVAGLTVMVAMGRMMSGHRGMIRPVALRPAVAGIIVGIGRFRCCASTVRLAPARRVSLMAMRLAGQAEIEGRFLTCHGSTHLSDRGGFSTVSLRLRVAARHWCDIAVEFDALMALRWRT